MSHSITLTPSGRLEKRLLMDPVKVSPAKVTECRSYISPGNIKITEWFFSVPVDWHAPDHGESRQLSLFARSVRRNTRTADLTTGVDGNAKRLPWMLYLQGGPGYGCPAPQDISLTSQMLERGYQLLLLDSRGTGLSTPVCADGAPGLPRLVRDDDDDDATNDDNVDIWVEYLKNFRADSIVRDCEAVRLALTEGLPETARKWSLVGQSFGGFVVTTYLSFYPEGLAEAFSLGGLPPLVASPDEVYKKTWKSLVFRNIDYYEKYPEDVDRVKEIVRWLGSGDKGGVSGRQFRQLGVLIGFHGGIDRIHHLVLRCASDLNTIGAITRPTLSAINAALPYNDVPIYTILHEAIYCQGKSSNWSAQRIQKECFPQFNADEDAPRVLFLGEMVFPWMLADYPDLRPFAAVAERLAETKWPALYDEIKLIHNEVPLYAAIYQRDIYVNYRDSVETAACIDWCRTFETNMLYHDAIRAHSDELWKALWALRDDVLD